MCGISGFNFREEKNISDEDRMKLVLGLGSGIDNRGGHAAGYVSINEHSIKYCRKLGKWLKAKDRFLKGASVGNLCIMHARWATCGDRNSVIQAHPFNIKRNDQTVLFGCHNGMISGAFESAKEHGRKIEVDSQEVFELIADKDYDAIQKLTGYGVITWIAPDKKDRVNVVKLSNHADICIIKTKEGGMVWGSTWEIVSSALKLAGLTAGSGYKELEVGRVYEIHHSDLYSTDITGIKLGDRYASSQKSYSWSWDEDDTDAKKYYGAYSGYGGGGYSGSGHNSGSKKTTGTSVKDGKISCPNGDEEWYKNGELHRDNDEPAVIKRNGDKEWYQYGQQHRIGKPAVERANGGFSYYLYGQIHREDGPALRYVSHKNDTKPWEGHYLHNQHYKDVETWEAAKNDLVARREKLKKEDQKKKDEKKDESKKTDKDNTAGHAFLREMEQLWKKWDDEEESEEDSEKNRFLTKGMM